MVNSLLVSAGYHKTDAIFHVVKGTGPSILSRVTSERYWKLLFFKSFSVA